jgi:hypothetical protein
MKKNILSILMILLFFFSQAQSGQEYVKSLLKEISLKSYFIYEECFPISPLDSFDLQLVKERAKEENEVITVPDSIILELFDNTNKQKTFLKWTQDFLPHCLLIKNKSKKIPTTRLNKNTRLYNLAEKWNKQDFSKNPEIIYQYSFPVFDKTFEYALIEYGYSKNNLNGRWRTDLYHFENGKWIYILTIKSLIS